MAAQVATTAVYSRASAGRPSNSTNASADRANESPTVAHASRLDARLPK